MVSFCSTQGTGELYLCWGTLGKWEESEVERGTVQCGFLEVGGVGYLCHCLASFAAGLRVPLRWDLDGEELLADGDGWAPLFLLYCISLRV